MGSTSVATTSAGAEIANSRVQHYPFGATRSGGSALPTEYRYTGQRREPSLGLYDYNARFYEPRTGRFQSPDTLVPRPGDPQSLNRYAYARNFSPGRIMIEVSQWQWLLAILSCALAVPLYRLWSKLMRQLKELREQMD